MCRNRKLLEDILFPYHRAFKNPQVQKHYLNKNILSAAPLELYVEQAMSHVAGKYLTLTSGQFAPSDFTDLSDSKVSGTRGYPQGHKGNSYFGRIAGVANKISNGQIVTKPGALRVVIYIDPIDELRFFYLPKNKWDPHMINSLGKLSTKKCIIYTYNSVKDHISKFKGYQIKSFRQLCLK